MERPGKNITSFVNKASHQMSYSANIHNIINLDEDDIAKAIIYFYIQEVIDKKIDELIAMGALPPYPESMATDPSTGEPGVVGDLVKDLLGRPCAPIDPNKHYTVQPGDPNMHPALQIDKKPVSQDAANMHRAIGRLNAKR